MSSTIIFPGSQGNNGTQRVTATFTGDVYLGLIHAEANVAIANVTFMPCARTHWHTHEHGQMIKVVTGSGWICDKGGIPRQIRAGDTAWAPAGTTHWHGADAGSVMTHQVIAFGKTTWLAEVTDDEYNKKD
ncbi:hypothetical protein NKR23_g10188 [Pleurostoma richardsiae]|jgi:quercetin dioxygenase-like cupin family protein|uniref:Cupin type-2 domain-containing protein n=1 Tax=Pleurostoma richardsiae TaxID=41990 RepID=A0AA38R5K0_9PEZI|nr:hypothetical protein NKR23_g10188 [Pleurostoma richardsiae]